jgi:hypothetical protein
VVWNPSKAESLLRRVPEDDRRAPAAVRVQRDSVALPINDARVAVDGLTSDWLRRYAVFAASDGLVTPEELATFRRAATVLGAPPSLAAAPFGHGTKASPSTMPRASSQRMCSAKHGCAASRNGMLTGSGH